MGTLQCFALNRAIEKKKQKMKLCFLLLILCYFIRESRTCGPCAGPALICPYPQYLFLQVVGIINSIESIIICLKTLKQRLFAMMLKQQKFSSLQMQQKPDRALYKW